MPRDVFISYQHDDLTVAQAVCDTLEATNLRCWISARDQKPGEDWMEALVRGLEDSRIVVFILSANSNNSKACRKELKLAEEVGMPVIPLRVEDIAPTGDLRYLLAGLHRLDALERPIDQHLDALVEAVQNLMGSRPDEHSHTQSTKESIVEPKRRLDDLETFRAERLGKLYKRKGPPLLNGACPKLVLHVVPSSIYEERHRKINLKPLERDNRVEPLYIGSTGPPIYNRNSIMKNFVRSDVNAVESSVEIFENGIIEAIKLIYTPAVNPGERSIDPLYEEDIVKQLPQYVSVLEQHDISLPIYVALSFQEVQGWYIWVDVREVGHLQWVQHHIPLTDDQVPTEWEFLDNFADVKTPARAARFMKPVFDVLWREAGWWGSLNYDEEGNWKRELKADSL